MKDKPPAQQKKEIGIYLLLGASSLLILTLVGTLLTLCLSEAWGPTYKTFGKILLIGLCIPLWFITQKLLQNRGFPKAPIGDKIHEWTKPWHQYLSDNPTAANKLLIVSSLGIDLLGISLILGGVFGPSLSPIIGLILLFAFRQLCQFLCALPAPPGMIWRDPKSPSLFVTYKTENDFFISGHTAIAVLAALYALNSLPLFLGAIVGLLALGEALTVLILRAHYTMDVLAAIAAAGSAYALAQTLSNTLRI
jgi:hypothetical protein